MAITDLKTQYFHAKYWYLKRFGDDGIIKADDFASFVAVNQLSNPKRNIVFATLLIDMYRIYSGRDHSKTKREHTHYEDRDDRPVDEILHDHYRSEQMKLKVMKLVDGALEKEFAERMIFGDETISEVAGATYDSDRPRYLHYYYYFRKFVNKLNKAGVLCE